MLLKYASIHLCKWLFWAYGFSLCLGTVLRGTFPHKVISECSVLSGTRFLPPSDCPENWCGALAKRQRKNVWVCLWGASGRRRQGRLVSVFCVLLRLLSAKRLATRGPERWMCTRPDLRVRCSGLTECISGPLMSHGLALSADRLRRCPTCDVWLYLHKAGNLTSAFLEKLPFSSCWA